MPSSTTPPSSRPLNPAFNLILFLVKIILDMIYSIQSITFSSRPVTSSPTLKPSASSSPKPYDPSNDESNNDNDTTHGSTSQKDPGHDLDHDLPPKYDDLTSSSTLPNLTSCHHNHPHATSDHDSASEIDHEDLNQTSSDSDCPHPADSLTEKALQLKKLTWSDAGLPGLFLRSTKNPLPSIPDTQEITAVSEPVPAVDLHVAVRTPAASVRDMDVPVTFTVQYPNSSAANVYLTGSLPSLKSWSPHDAIPMTRSGIHGVWNVTVPLPPSIPFEYKYIHKPHPEHVIWDNGPNRRSTSLSLPATSDAEKSAETIQVTFQVYAETVWGEHILVTGSSSSLHSWSPSSAIRLSTSPAQYPMWSVTIPLQPNAEKPLEFKFIRRHEHRDGVWWESGSNRVVQVQGGESTVVVDGVWRW